MLVTGASRGIGAASVVLAAERGYDVAIGYRRDSGAAESVAGRVRALGARAVTVGADVANENDVERMFAAVDAGLGTLSVLVNNAGSLDLQMRLDEMTLDRVERTFAVNVLGVFLCCRAAVRRMSTRHGVSAPGTALLARIDKGALERVRSEGIGVEPGGQQGFDLGE